MIDSNRFADIIRSVLRLEFGTDPQRATAQQLHYAVGKAVIDSVYDRWCASEETAREQKRAFYLSAEYLMGRAIGNNIFCTGEKQAIEQALGSVSILPEAFEEIEDEALGNGGLGRLAACFLDSAATLGLPLDGYGLLYEFGLFHQKIREHMQREVEDDWNSVADPWLLPKVPETVSVSFYDEDVLAVPYDMPIIGYGGNCIRTLRLWKSTSEHKLNFARMDSGDYEGAVRLRDDAELLTSVLYPNDSTPRGKELRLRQEYFLCSASIQDMLRRFHRDHPEENIRQLPEYFCAQLNDTHPVLAIPELVRILADEESVEFDEAVHIASKVFAYTNHTIMAEALEQWDGEMMGRLIPRVYEVIAEINRRFFVSVCTQGKEKLWPALDILPGNRIHMARLALAVCHTVNGVAKIHTQLLREKLFPEWVALHPERFQNKTNGITPRRWLCVANPGLASLITRLLGGEEWITDLRQLSRLERYADSETVMREFRLLRAEKKQELCAYLQHRQGTICAPDAVFDVQIKRLHEYKRQLLNALAIYVLFRRLQRGEMREFPRTVFLFAAKAAPSYHRAKAVIHFIEELADLISKDETVSERIQVVFAENYDVSLAQKIMGAADISEQISTAGTEASGTGNMKLMLSGAVTLGTFDGANVEIVEQAGRENNYIFGATVEELEQVRGGYQPQALLDQNPELHQAVNALVDGTFRDDESGMLRSLYDSLLHGGPGGMPDNYFVLYDFERYLQAKLCAITNAHSDLSKGWRNLCRAGEFSSDRTVGEYARDIWHITPGTVLPKAGKWRYFPA